jgi:hypothetical protein
LECGGLTPLSFFFLFPQVGAAPGKGKERKERKRRQAAALQSPIPRRRLTAWRRVRKLEGVPTGIK